MLAVLITLTPGHRNEFIECPKAEVRIAVLPITDVKTRWESTPELLEHAFRLREFTPEWLENPTYSDYRPLLTTQVDWTIVKYVMEVLRRFRYWTLSMSKRHKVTLHYVITVYNDMFDHMDGVMRDLAKKQTPSKEDSFFAVKLARQKPSKYYAGVTPSTAVLLIAEHILDSFRKLRSFRNCDTGRDINPEDEWSYTAQYEKGFLRSMENDDCAKHQSVPVNKQKSFPRSNLIPSNKVLASCQSFFDP